MNISKLGEFGLIEVIRTMALIDRKVICGIGDDAAVLPYTKSKYLLFTTDMLAEGTHFTRRMKAPLIGRKALACNISDIAAMGGTPTYAVVSIGLPKSMSVDFVKNLYKGLAAIATDFGISIVGGDTMKSSTIVINIALLGEVEKKCLVRRSGAKPGDWIFVSGPLGGSYKSGRHLTFTPRVHMARLLVKNFRPHAMIDISDGLAGDLNHILEASGVGAKLWEHAIPCQKGISLKQAISEGEDFELLFTLSAAKARQLLHWQFKHKKFSFYPIGEITADSKQKLHAKGYAHF